LPGGNIWGDKMNYKDCIKQNHSWEEIAEKLYEARKMKLFYTKITEQLMEKLLKLSNNKKSMGKDYAFHYSYRIGNVDYNSIPELHNVDLNKYRKEDIRVWKLESIQSKILDKMTPMSEGL